MTIQLKIAAREAHEAFAAYAEAASELQVAVSRLGQSNQPLSHREMGVALVKLHQQGVALLERVLARGKHSLALRQALQAPDVTAVLCRFDAQIAHFMSEEGAGRMDRRQLDDAIKGLGRAAQERIATIIGLSQEVVAAVEDHPGFEIAPRSRSSVSTSIEHDAETALLAIASHGNGADDPERGNHQLGDANLVKVTGLSGLRLKDVVDVLEARGFLQYRKRTTSDPVGFIRINAEARVEAERLNAPMVSVSAETPPAHETWTRRWWRVPGESLLNGTPIAGKVVSAKLTWCRRHEWGVTATYADGNADLIFNVEVASHDREPSFIDTGAAPDYAIRILGEHLMRRLGRGMRNAAQDPVIVELAKQFPTTTWVSGTRLRHTTKLPLEEFDARIEKLVPRFVRRQFSLDPSHEMYALTLPALLLVDPAHTDMIERVFQAIAHRFRLDPDATIFDRSDLVAIGWSDPDLKLVGRLAEVSLLVDAQPDDRATFRMPKDREAISEAVKQRVPFVRYLMEAADGESRRRRLVQRPWLTAPLWFERDGTSTDFVPGPMLWQVPWDRQDTVAERGQSPGAEPGATDEQHGAGIATSSGRFEIAGRVGEGRFAEVYRARDTLLKREVAIKFVRRDAIGVTALEHARALARVTHANIVSVFNIETLKHPNDGQVVDAVVMELVEGVELTERLGRPLGRDEAFRISNAIVDGIAAYHAHGLAHLDLHEANVMVGADSLKILDPLYFDTAVLSSTATRAAQQARDLKEVRNTLAQVLALVATEEQVLAFERANAKPTLESLRSSLTTLVDARRMFIANLPPQADDESHANLVAGFSPGPVADCARAMIASIVSLEPKPHGYAALLSLERFASDSGFPAQVVGDASSLLAEGGLVEPHRNSKSVQLTRLGREEAHRLGEPVPSPAEDADRLLRFLATHGNDGTNELDNGVLCPQLGFHYRQLLDAGESLEVEGAADMSVRMTSGGNRAVLKLTARGRAAYRERSRS